MSNETQNMINAATNNDGAAFKASFEAVINQKVGDILQVQRQDIAQNIFGNIRVPTQNEATLDEGKKLAGGWIRKAFIPKDAKGKASAKKGFTIQLIAPSGEDRLFKNLEDAEQFHKQNKGDPKFTK